MDLQQNRRSTSDVVEQLRLLIAHHHPKLFEDFLDYIDPTNEVERQETTKEPTKTEDIRSLPKFGSKALSDHSASAYAGLLSRTFVHPGQPASPLRHVANFAQYPVKAKSPSPDRRIGNESSPGMYGFPEPPLVYSPVPPTFAQSFYDYVNQEQFTPRYPVETAMPTHGLPMPPIAAVSPRDVQQGMSGNIIITLPNHFIILAKCFRRLAILERKLPGIDRHIS
jgi:hypothetical protein